jgi:hypothetical protein
VSKQPEVKRNAKEAAHRSNIWLEEEAKQKKPGKRKQTKKKSNETPKEAAHQLAKWVEEGAHQRKVHKEPVIQNTEEAVTLPCANWLSSTMPPTKRIHQDPQHPRKDVADLKGEFSGTKLAINHVFRWFTEERKSPFLDVTCILIISSTRLTDCTYSSSLQSAKWQVLFTNKASSEDSSNATSHGCRTLQPLGQRNIKLPLCTPGRIRTRLMAAPSEELDMSGEQGHPGSAKYQRRTWALA